MVVGAVESNQADHQTANGLNPALAVTTDQPPTVLLEFWRNRSELAGCTPPATRGAFGIKLSHRSPRIQHALR